MSISKRRPRNKLRGKAASDLERMIGVCVNCNRYGLIDKKRRVCLGGDLRTHPVSKRVLRTRVEACQAIKKRKEERAARK